MRHRDLRPGNAVRPEELGIEHSTLEVLLDAGVPEWWFEHARNHPGSVIEVHQMRGPVRTGGMRVELVRIES